MAAVVFANITSARAQSTSPVATSKPGETCTATSAFKLVDGDKDSIVVCHYGPAQFFIEVPGVDGPKRIALEPGMPLLPGYVVSIDAASCTHDKHPESRAQILNAGVISTINCDKQKVTIAKSPGQGSIGQNVWTLLLRVIGQVRADEYTQQSISAVSRGQGDRLTLGILQPAQIVPDANSCFDLPWNGGTAPYTLRVENRGGATLHVLRTSAQAQKLCLPTTPAGKYRIFISDAAGTQVSGNVHVIEGALPKLSSLEDSSRAAFADPQTQRLWYAVWLVSRNDSYKLAAYNVIAGDLPTFTESELYGRRLAGTI